MAEARAVMHEVAPKLAELSADVLFGDVWERRGLSKRDRSLITVASLIAMYRTDQLRGHIRRALDNGVTKEEISMCGFGPNVAMLAATKQLGAKHAELIKYATSGDVSGDRDMVVGYAGIALL